MADLCWSDGQWQKVKDAVADAFEKATVAGKFLTGFRNVSGGAEIARNERVVQLAGTPSTIRLDGLHNAVNLPFVNVTVNVELTTEQVADETLWNALLLFRRAANILALQQDLVVFSGYARGFTNENSQFVVNQVPPQRGLADLPARNRDFDPVRRPVGGTVGQGVVNAVVIATGNLERTSNPGPFTCVLGDNLFNAVQTPAPSLALPADSIKDLLRGGSLLRSGMMEADTGIVVSTAANAVDIVIGTPPTAQFLQRQADGRFLFRVYERFVLRIRDDVTSPIAGFRIRPSANEMDAERELIIDLGF